MIFQLEPACKDYLWGGSRLKTDFNKQIEGDILAESWELSCNRDGLSHIQNGPYAGKSLREVVEANKTMLGRNCQGFADFPVLVKLIDAKQPLSIQVHPDDGYALEHENQYGKTEMWHVLDCEPGSFLYFGMSAEISEEEFRRRISDGTLTEVLHQAFVQPGDTFFIEAGTLHAIGAGILLVEIQQNSNVTYRVFDYNRRDKDGNLRELHIDKAIAVTRREQAHNHPTGPGDLLYSCDKFTVRKFSTSGSLAVETDGSSFHHIMVLDGEGSVTCGPDTLPCHKGDSFFLPADSGRYVIDGICNGVITTV